MTPGVPGAGIGGLFYLASTLLLPLRSLSRRLRGLPDSLTFRQALHACAIAGGVIAALWTTGWALALVVPDEMLSSAGANGIASMRARTILPVATFATAVGTLLAVLIAVEIARYAQARRDPLETRREERTR